MKHVKRVMAFALMVCIVVALCASATAPETGEQPEKDGGWVVGFCNYTVSNSWQTQMEAEFKYAAENLVEEGVLSEYYVTNADGDANKQISDFKDLMTKGCDAIIITAASASALSPVCEEATEGRTEGAMNVFEKYPDIEIVSQVNADWDYAKAKVAVEGLLSSGTKVDAIWSQGGAMTQAAVDAFNEAGEPLVPMSGEGSNGFLKVWKENLDKGFSSVCPGYPTYISEVALQQAIRALNGEEIEALYMLPTSSIGDDDIDDYYDPDLPESYWVDTHLPDDQIKEIFK